MDLREYEQVKFRLAELLRVSGASSSQLSQETQNSVREVFSRLAEDRFNLVVVGRFSRGKSSLMNAVLGVDRLPTGIRPLTSVITTVAYGSQEKAVIHFAGLGIPQEVPLSALPQYVTEQGNSGNYRRVTIAQIQLPIELLRRGFHFIDTPGLGSPIIENTRTTERFLPEADAFVLVTSYEGPLSEEEIRFLRGAATARQPVFIVVNKQDIAGPAERDDALRYLREQLHGLLDGQGLGIFSLSARDGLAAKLKGDAQALAASGVGRFEAELVRFLIHEKSREFLIRMCQRIAGVINKIPSRPNTSQVKEQILAIARGIDGGRPTSPFPPPLADEYEAVSLPTQSRPCEICHHVAGRCLEFLRHFQYDITVSPQHQQRLSERGGLCSFHTWVYEQMASPQGTCAGYAAVLDRWASRLLATAESPNPGANDEARRSFVSDSVVCLVCDEQSAAVNAAVAALVGRLRQSPATALSGLSELCLPHLRLVTAALGPGSITTKLLVREAAILRRMAEDMRRYALKHDGLRRYLASEEETKAAERALMILAGHRTLNTPSRY